MKHATRILLAAALVLFGTAAWPFADGFEASALEPSDIKAISIDAAPAVSVQNVKVDAAGLLTAIKVEPPAPPGGCKITDPLIKPAGFTEMRVSWSSFMNGAPFPKGNSYLSTNGSFTFRSLSPSTNGVPMAGRYITIPFVAPAAGTPKLVWLGVQRQAEVPLYTKVRPAKAVFVSVSPCAGDLRPPDVFSKDPSLSACRAITSAGNLFFGPNAACKLTAGQPYFINIAFVDPRQPLSPTLTTCSNASDQNRCEFNFNAQ